jgi:cyclopropane fatty-acyl-phospholipid synthase-like methyltransferase
MLGRKTMKRKVRRIRVTYSPWKCDDDLPWEYDPDAFLNWVDEVFFPGGEKPSIEEAVEHLESQGYKVEVIE